MEEDGRRGYEIWKQAHLKGPESREQSRIERAMGEWAKGCRPIGFEGRNTVVFIAVARGLNCRVASKESGRPEVFIVVIRRLDCRR